MVKKLRRKFVIVTTTLMLVVFGTFFTVNYFYNSFWNNKEIVGMLDWIAYSGIFTSNHDIESTDDLILEMVEDERPIIGIILDEDNRVLSSRVIGIDEKTEIEYIDKNVLLKMINQGNDDYKVGKYYYSYNKINNNQTLLVIMDDRFHGSIILWLLGIVLLTTIGVLALVGITFYLSKYVTEPAQQSLEREKRFISDASHELKTPLGAICINAQALEFDNQDNPYLKNILTESNRMNRLIERLLTLSKLDEAEIKDTNKICISDLCDEMALTYETLAYEKGVNFSYDIEPDINIMGNEDEIRQLLVILIDNALKNVNQMGFVELVCHKYHNHVQIIISNTGHGIMAEELPYIFERFYTTDKARKNSSFGLGLSIAKSIAERHDGTIEVRSDVDKITEFTIKLPCLFSMTK